MTAHESTEWPVAPAALADIVADASQPTPLRDDAARQLQGFLRQMARRVLCCRGGWRLDLANDLVVRPSSIDG